MAVRFVVRPNDGVGVRRVRRLKGQIEEVKLDFTVWSEQAGIGALTAATAEVVSGTAEVESEGFSSDVWTGRVSTPDAGGSLVKVTATGNNLAVPVMLRLLARDPAYAEGAASDYWY